MTKHTDTSRSGDLVERLREMGEHPCRSELPMGEDLRRAADRIEALSAENERLQLECKAQYDRGYYDGRQYDMELARAHRAAMSPERRAELDKEWSA